jgi:MFS family permease
VVSVAISKWFVRRRGWAISLASSGFSLATLIMPVAVTAVVISCGWRGAYIVLALFFWALMLPAALVMRREPEDYGLLPDGQRPGEALHEAERRQIERARRDFDGSYTRHEALRTSAFWMLNITFGLFVGANIAMLFHAIPYMTGSGFTPAQAGFAFATTGITGLIAKFVWGAALQRAHRFGARQFSALAAGSAGASTLLLIVATANQSMPAAFLACLLWGFGFGSVTPLSEFMWASYFGRRHLGAVRSAGTPFSVGATALGPLLVAYWFDVTGSYDGAFVAMTIAYALAAMVILASREPPPRTAAGVTPLTVAPAGGGERVS